MKTNVRDTSRAAYHTIDRNTNAYKIACVILENTKAGKPSTINSLYRQTGMLPGSVSGRLNDIAKDGVIIDGIPYKLQEAGKKRDEQTFKTVTIWALVVDRAKEATQLEMF